MSLLLCCDCGQWKDAEAFERTAKTARGRRGYCMACRPPAEPEPPKPLPPRWLRRAMCGKKQRYRSQAQALSAAVRSAKRAERMRVYECPLCKGWHLTHKEARVS